MGSPGLDVGDSHVGEPGAVPGLPAVILPALELEDVDLLALHLAQHFGGDPGPLHRRGAGTNGLTVRREQHFVEGERRARFGVKAGQADGLSRLRLELLAQGPENGVHLRSSPSKSEPASLISERGLDKWRHPPGDAGRHSSTIALRRPSASSHWPEIRASQCRTSSRRRGSIRHTRSRPRRRLRASPARASTWRCLVTAWRETDWPSVRSTMEAGPPVHRRLTSRSRVPSPRAAKTPAVPARVSGERTALAALGDIPRNGLHLLGPALLVAPVRLLETRRRQALEPRLAQSQERAALGA